MDDKKQRKKWIKRLRTLTAITITITLVLIARLAYLQIYKHEYYVQQAEKYRLRPLVTEAPRGDIVDANGELLVTNRPGFAISLLDQGSGYDEVTIERLSELLNISEEEIWEQVRQHSYRRYIPVRLKEDVDYATMAIVEEHMADLQGVIIEKLPVRNYVKGNFASHMLGYLYESKPADSVISQWVDNGYDYQVGDRVGATGLEQVWEPYLRGEDGEVQVLVNPLGQPISYLQQKDPIPGDTLKLTLDWRLQAKAEELLQQYIADYQEKTGIDIIRVGSLVALVPDTGAILTMASYPGYDPNTFSLDYPDLITNPAKPLLNRAISAGYPVGSSFKPLTGIAALEEGEITDRSRILCNGVIYVDGRTKRCLGTHGNLNIYQALEKSCNIFFYTAGAKVGIDRLESYARQFGFGSPTGLDDIPGEIGGKVAGREEKAKVSQYPWYRGETMDAAIGQGYHSITPLQLANYVSMLANGGNHYRPYLVDAVISTDGTVTEFEPELLNQTDVSPETLKIITDGMELVSGSGGTAYYLNNLPVKIVAKTGTAETGKTYEGKQLSHSVFVGFWPRENPRIAVAALVEYAGLGGAAGRMAGDFISYFAELQTGGNGQ